eukprot:g3897.t1
MAAQGMTLTRHYCAAPVCAPSRASLLTGLTQGHAQIRDNQFDKKLPDTHTLGTVLQEAGYATAAIGKWGLQGKSPFKDSNTKGKTATGRKPGNTRFPDWASFPTKRGFDEYYGYVRHVDGHYHYPMEDGREIWHNQNEVAGDLDLCYTTDLFTARAKKWITEQTREHSGQPFFLYLAHDTPHAILQNPPCAYPAGGGLDGGIQWTGKPHAMINTATGVKDGWMHPEIAAATWDHDNNPATDEQPWPEVQQRYANGVRRIDDSVGDILTLLTDLGIAENTIVVFTSDNGPSQESYLKGNPYNPNFFHGFGPFEGIKRDTLEGGLREPTIVHWPARIPSASTSATPTGHWDWLATFTEAAGLVPPAASDGVSLMPVLTGEGGRTGGLLYVEYSNGSRTPAYPEFSASHRNRKRGQMQVVMIDGYKGLRYDVKSASQDFEIYDLAKDPREINNLAKNPEFRELQQTMKARALQSRMPSPGASRPYDKAPVPAAKIPASPAGISWSFHRGEWPWMPDFRALAPASSGISPGIALPPAVGTEKGGVHFEGYIKIPADGPYTFTVTADGGSMLFVHDKRVIDEGKAPARAGKTATIPLRAGWHPFRLLFRATNDTPSLRFDITGPDGSAIEPSGDNLRQAAN